MLDKKSKLLLRFFCSEFKNSGDWLICTQNDILEKFPTHFSRDSVLMALNHLQNLNLIELRSASGIIDVYIKHEGLTYREINNRKLLFRLVDGLIGFVLGVLTVLASQFLLSRLI